MKSYHLNLIGNIYIYCFIINSLFWTPAKGICSSTWIRLKVCENKLVLDVVAITSVVKAKDMTRYRRP